MVLPGYTMADGTQVSCPAEAKMIRIIYSLDFQHRGGRILERHRTCVVTTSQRRDVTTSQR